MKKKIVLFAIVSSALWLALMDLLPVSAQGPTPLGAQVGKPWRGAPGRTETVAQIMARELRAPQAPSAVRAIRPLRTLKNVQRKQPPSPNLPRLIAPKAPQALSSPQGIGGTFLGVQVSEAGYVPPDSMGAVGPSQVLVVVNGRIKVFDKTTSVVGGLNASLDTFFSATNAVDPSTRYDRLSQRWFVTAIDVDFPNQVLIAVSSGPTIVDGSSFTFFSFQHDLVGTTPNADTGREADYPSLGVDNNSLYIGVNVFNGGLLSGTTGFVVDKSDLFSSTLTVTAFRQLTTCSGSPASCTTGPFSPRGVQNDDPNATEGYFIGVDASFFSTLTMRRITYPSITPTISANILVGVDLTTYPLFGVPALGTATSLDDIDDRLFQAQIHQNKLTSASTLWTAHNIEVDSTGVACGPYVPSTCTNGGRDGSRWYEIGSLTTTPTRIQQGTLFSTASSNPRSYWMPSVAMSGQGHMALGASFASAADYAGIALAGRLSGDTSGATQSPTIAQAGLGAYNLGAQTPKRWGDYSMTVVDPNDDMTMWTFQEYANATDSWGVRVIRLVAPPPAMPASASPSSVGTLQASVDVTITGVSLMGSGFFDPGSDSGGPGFTNHISATASSGVIVNSATFNNPTQVMLNISTMSATAGFSKITITNPDGQHVTADCILTITDGVTTIPPCTVLYLPFVRR